MRTDYLVVGAGTAGLSFVDSLLDADPTADVVLVDRRSGPGGHWLDGYPFLRLHLPSALYGVESTALGVEQAADPRDRGGPLRAGERRGGVRLLRPGRA